MSSASPAGDRDNLFVAGCARSGTTALTRLLNQHPDIAVSIERYNRITEPKNFTLTVDGFTGERFFHPNLDETHYTDFDAKHRNLADDLRAKFDTARYVGDKKPRFYEVYDQLFATFPNAKAVFIYRDPLEVASSYEGRRAKGDNWPDSHDYRKAVEHWNLSLQLTVEAAKKYPGQILVVDYAGLFIDNLAVDAIWTFLDLDPELADTAGIDGMRSKSVGLAERREQRLSAKELSYVKATVNGGLLAAVQRLNPLRNGAPDPLAKQFPNSPTRSASNSRLRRLTRRLAGR